VAEKIEYWTQEGHKNLYLIVSFLPVADGTGTVERAIEFFMPVGQSGESQQWITSSMRMLSLAARGGFLDRALATCARWPGTAVRCAWARYEKADGTACRCGTTPRWRPSPIAVQNIMARRAQPRAAGATMRRPVPSPA
jgi:ribonucleoside-diphosphate reductase alpha chain